MCGGQCGKRARCDFQALFLLALVAFSSTNTDEKSRLLVQRIGPSVSAIHIANGDGTGERQLLSISALDYNPALSPDGQLGAEMDAIRRHHFITPSLPTLFPPTTHTLLVPAKECAMDRRFRIEESEGSLRPIRACRTINCDRKSEEQDDFCMRCREEVDAVRAEARSAFVIRGTSGIFRRDAELRRAVQPWRFRPKWVPTPSR